MVIDNSLLALLLLFVANGAPIMARKWLGNRYATPLDFGVKFKDGRPWLGSAKTLRGIISSLTATTLAAAVFGLSFVVGIQFALAAMIGDLSSSFIKRRLGKRPSDRALALDHIPEALLPLWVTRAAFNLTVAEVFYLTFAFWILALLTSRVLYHWHIRMRPY